LPAGGRGGAGGGDPRRPARPGRPGGRAAAAGGRRGPAGGGGAWAARGRGRRDTGNPKGLPGGRGKRGAVRRGRVDRGGGARGGHVEAPRRGGGAVTGAVVTVGTFEGIHRGHQEVVAEVVRKARGAGLEGVLVTFDPHPLAVVNPAAAPQLLTLPDEKRELLARTGLARVELLPFTPELARLGPEEFLRDVLRTRYAMHDLVLGYDHGFGRSRSGDVEAVRRIGARDGFGVDVVDAVRDDGQPISSTVIRAAVAHGDLVAAEPWLGRAESLRRLRDVQAFPSREALVQQLERDRVAARQTLNL